MSLAGEILDRWAPVLAELELRSGDRGRFELLLDGEEIFSKARLGRFPERDEVVKLLEPRLGPPPRWRSQHR